LTRSDYKDFREAIDVSGKNSIFAFNKNSGLSIGSMMRPGVPIILWAP